MQPTQKLDARPGASDVKVRLRVEIYDALAKQRGITTVVAQAALHGIGRQHMFDLRAGRTTASLPLAMRMASDMGTSVEALFGWAER